MSDPHTPNTPPEDPCRAGGSIRETPSGEQTAAETPDEETDASEPADHDGSDRTAGRWGSRPAGPTHLLLAAVAVILLAAATGAALTRVGEHYVTYRPGPAFDAAQFIHIGGGADPGAEDDTILVLTLMMAETAPFELVEQLWEPAIEIHLRTDEIFDIDWEQQNHDTMAEAKTSATWAAAAALGVADPFQHSLGAHVVGIYRGLPADGKLRIGDVIETVEVGGETTRISTNTDLSQLVGAQPPGTELVVGYRRDGKAGKATLTTAEVPPGPPGGDTEAPNSIIGVIVQTWGGDLDEVLDPGELEQHHLNVEWVDTFDVGGPSAGLAFALEILDQGNDIIEDRGRVIAVTGTIDRAGNVGPVGGILQKTQAAVDAGADMMVVPEANRTEVLEALEQIGADLEVVPVAHINDAIEALNRQ